MTDFLASNIEALEALYIHPTMHVDDSMASFNRTIMDSDMQKARFAEFVFDDDVQKTHSIHDFYPHNFSSSYSSEEESASPQASADSLSLHSYDGDVVFPPPMIIEPSSTVLEALKPEQLANSCSQIEHRCNRAQAITLKTVGKPKVVSLARVVEISPPKTSSSLERKLSSFSTLRPSTRRSMRPSLEAVVRVSKVVEEDLPSKSSQESLSQADKSSQTGSSIKSESSSARRKPSVPLLRAAAAFDPFSRPAVEQPPAMPRRKTLMKRAHTATASVPVAHYQPGLAEDSPQLTYESPTKRRLHRLASSLSLGNARDLMRRKDSLASLRKPATPTTVDSSAPSITLDSTPITPAAPVPTRRSSMGKLTPRGPTERAPIIVLPPCPDDDEEDDDFLSVSPVEALQKWDRSRARRVHKANKSRPSIDDIVARLM